MWFRCRATRHLQLALIAASGLALAADASSATLDPKRFPVPEQLEPNVAFWTKVYSQYDSHHVLLHDELHMGIIYAVIDTSPIMESGMSAGRKEQKRRALLQSTRNKYRSILQDLAAGRTSRRYAEDQRRVQDLFRDVSGGRSKYSSAVGRLRTQRCLKDQFAEGIQRSGIYMAEIEAIFERHGMPRELTRLPFVESLFQWKARSSAQAGGIWQFVRSTGRLYLDIELEYDERFDPLIATEAAAKHLAGNYKSLKTWPLAITAYNHGRAGMRRAVRRVGTRDIGEITRRYRSRLFGFASRNFYSEFVAAYEVYENRAELFPGVEPFPALRYDEYRPQGYVALRDLARAADTDLDILKKMNPALSSTVWSGDVYLPKSYRLLVPEGRGQSFETAYASLPANRTSPHQVGHYYRVRRGDTLSKIADKFGTSTSRLQQANKLRSVHRISIGQRLLIPPGSRRSPSRGPSTTRVAAADRQETPGLHVVRRGETLSAIAEAYDTSVSELRSRNGLRSANRITVGQRLKLPPADGSARTHVVRSGETLASIARRYGTTVRALKSANKIRTHIIQPRQVLVIPSPS